MKILGFTLFLLLISNHSVEEAPVTHKVEGPFSVKLAPQQDENAPANLGRMTLDKTYEGPLQATAQGQMLTAMTAVKGSAGYVAVERVEGSLQGKKGGFTLQHSGTMAHGSQQLSITVVPDSGTGELEGISGEMDIRIEEGGSHFYVFRYTLPQ